MFIFCFCLLFFPLTSIFGPASLQCHSLQSVAHRSLLGLTKLFSLSLSKQSLASIHLIHSVSSLKYDNGSEHWMTVYS